MKQNQEQVSESSNNSLLIWIIASILLHLLIFLIILLLHFTYPHTKKNTFELTKKEKETALLLVDPKTKTINKKTKELPEEKKTQEKNKQATQLQYHLIPGNKGIDFQHIQNNTETILNQQTPMPKEQEIKKTDTPNDNETIQQPVMQNIKKAQKEKILPEQSFPQNKDALPIPSKEQEKIEAPTAFDTEKFKRKNKVMQPDQKEQKNIFNKTAHTQSLSNKKKDSDSCVSKKTMSLKDLQLGFNKFLNNIGNTQHLIQYGNTSLVPQGEDLKYITYINQCANFMITAITTHPKWGSSFHKPGDSFTFYISIDRKGKLLDFHTIKNSSNSFHDDVVIDALKNSGLFPPLPRFITQDPFERNWTLLY